MKVYIANNNYNFIRDFVLCPIHIWCSKDEQNICATDDDTRFKTVSQLINYYCLTLRWDIIKVVE